MREGSERVRLKKKSISFVYRKNDYNNYGLGTWIERWWLYIIIL